MKIIIRHYGAFRKDGPETTLHMPLPATINAVRAALIAQHGEDRRLLVEDSAFANDTDILPDEYVIERECTLSILPPVCGG